MQLPEVWDNLWAVVRARWAFRRATHLGARVRVWGRVWAKNWGTLMVGERVRVIATVTPVELVALQGGTLEIGAGTFINYGCSIAASQLVRIGPRCSIGTYVIVMDNDYHRLEPDRRNEKPPSAPVVIGENVWLGARAIILRGVTIGAGSVIAAGSVVTRDIPAGVLAAGVPARVIRNLTPEEEKPA